MATCKGCIHYSVCIARTHENTLCDHFKNNADVVPVVRCKDCKHYRDSTGKRHKKCAYSSTNETDFLVMPDDFCNYGERKTNNE